MSLQNFPALVLNADFRPLSYFPLSLWPWQDAVKAVFLSRVNVVSEYEHVVRSPSIEIELPSVISLHDYVNIDRQPAFTRFNVFLRDAFTCQYCGGFFSSEVLTFDHIVPRSRGGYTSWDNVVTACAPCNLKKGNQSLERAKMGLFRMPVRPSNFQLQKNGRSFPPDFLHKSWSDFLYWDAELEQL
jgi:5-methylcytosine-specific restriction endonuclease McrA